MKSDSPNCQFHGYHGFRFTGSPEQRRQLRATGWRDTQKYGWICPQCIAKHPVQWGLTRLKERILKGDNLP